MPRQTRSNARKRHPQHALGPKLIGAGLLLGVFPWFLGHSPVGSALKPMAPFGWLLFALGCALLWWRVRRQHSRPGDAARATRTVPLEPLGGALFAPSPPRRVATDLEPMATQPQFRIGEPEPASPSWGADIFDVIEWRRFEALVEALFAQAGFETKSQSHGADEGIDIWLYSRTNRTAPVSIVQCKHWQGKRVGVDKVRELRGVMAAKGVSRGQFATTSTFTDDAITFAKESGVNLLDVKALLALIATRSEEQQQALLTVALEGDYWRPTCVNCGIKMIERKPRKGGALFWGCQSYPRCKTSMPMRGAARPISRPATQLAAGTRPT